MEVAHGVGQRGWNEDGVGVGLVAVRAEVPRGHDAALHALERGEREPRDRLEHQREQLWVGVPGAEGGQAAGFVNTTTCRQYCNGFADNSTYSQWAT